MKFKAPMVDAIIKELQLQRDYLKETTVETIYFGGGTPSVLNIDELSAIFTSIFELYQIGKNPEITLEANPDDLSQEKILQLKDTPINRLSIGIQSFSDDDLIYMNRAHNAGESETCIESALKAGFSNLTVDLIYGSPTTSDSQWEENLQKVFDYNIPHLSCYNLTVEPGTALDHFVKNKKAKPVDEEQSARQFEILIEQSAKAGFEHYEISNFAQPNCYSRHNSAYWQGKTYLGVGPSAHSFNGSTRQWNVAHNQQYLKSLEQGKASFEIETLSPEQQYNEYLMTGLRTIWGCSREKIKSIQPDFLLHFEQSVSRYLDEGLMEIDGNIYKLTKAGKFLADRIAMELFMD